MAEITKEDFKVILRNMKIYNIPTHNGAADNGKVLKIVNGRAQWVNP